MNNFSSVAVMAGLLAAANVFAAQPQFVPGELIVKFKNQSVRTLSQTQFLGIQITSANVIQGAEDLIVIQFDPSRDVQAVASQLNGNANIEYAEPNYILRAINLPELPETAPNDPKFPEQWNLQNNGQANCKGITGKVGADIKVVPAWDKGVTGSKDVLVAVIDTGVNWNHPDLKANIYTNPGEIADNGVDDDNNGYVDDVHGWNTATDSANSIDDHGHGSHCAGIIGASTNDGFGMAGINHHVSILSVKFLTAEGSGNTKDAIKAIAYARKMKAKVMSNSWGGGSFSRALEDEVKKTAQEGALFVAAAGNNGTDNDRKPHYPSNYAVENVVSVAASDNQDALVTKWNANSPQGSNYGANTVHIAAPGHYILSTTLDDNHECWSGTSMATPHVAGVAALMLSHDGNLTAVQVKDRLMSTADPFEMPGNRKIKSGRVNAYRAIFGTNP